MEAAAGSSSSSSNVHQDTPSPQEASSPEFFEVCSEGEEPEGVADPTAAGSKRQRRPSTSQYGESPMNIHTQLQMARECVARMALSVANTDPIVAPGAHLEAIISDCMLYTPLVFPTSATTHFTASSGLPSPSMQLQRRRAS